MWENCSSRLLASSMVIDGADNVTMIEREEKIQNTMPADQCPVEN